MEQNVYLFHEEKYIIPHYPGDLVHEKGRSFRIHRFAFAEIFMAPPWAGGFVS